MPTGPVERTTIRTPIKRPGTTDPKERTQDREIFIKISLRYICDGRVQNKLFECNVQEEE